MSFHGREFSPPHGKQVASFIEMTEYLKNGWWHATGRGQPLSFEYIGKYPISYFMGLPGIFFSFSLSQLLIIAAVFYLFLPVIPLVPIIILA